MKHCDASENEKCLEEKTPCCLGHIMTTVGTLSYWTTETYSLQTDIQQNFCGPVHGKVAIIATLHRPWSQPKFCLLMGGNNISCYPISVASIATFLMKWAQDFTSSLFDLSFSPVVQWGVVPGVLCVLIPSQATPGRPSAAQRKMGCACTPPLWWGLVAGRDKHLPLGPRLAWGKVEEKIIWLSASSILPNSDKRKQVTKLPNLRKWCFRLNLATSNLSLHQKHSSCWEIFKSRYHAIVLMSIYMTDTFCSFMRHVILKS